VSRRPGRGGGRPRRARGDGRRAGGADVLYGRNPVREALAAGRRRVRRVWATAGAAREPWLAGLDVAVVGAAEVEERCGSDAHQGICAEAEAYPYADAATLLRTGDPALLVALDEVQDPQNLGAVARTAECAGAGGLVIGERRSAEVTPAVAKASAGAVEHLPVARVRNLADFLADAKAAGLWCYGAHGTGEVAWDAADWAVPVVLVLGAEGKGLRPRVRSSCDQLVSLPLSGRIESLNVSASAAALLFEAVRRRRS
jgi:23S rRNA (guanosine2251-2'-O)-methyltransferase